VVCSAGPAGAAASLFLCKQGQSHLLVDKSSFPRTKVCGDGITQVCLTMLEQVIPDIKNHFARSSATIHPIKGFRLFYWFVKHPWKINWLVGLASKFGFIRNFFNNAANMHFSLRELKNPLHWGRIF
jgi:hypothetical protein